MWGDDEGFRVMIAIGCEFLKIIYLQNIFVGVDGQDMFIVYFKFNSWDQEDVSFAGVFLEFFIEKEFAMEGDAKNIVI